MAKPKKNDETGEWDVNADFPPKVDKEELLGKNFKVKSFSEERLGQKGFYKSVVIELDNVERTVFVSSGSALDKPGIVGHDASMRKVDKDDGMFYYAWCSAQKAKPWEAQ